MTSLNSQNPMVNWLIEASWQTALLAALLSLLFALFRNQIPPRWRYALWLLVAARLLLPTLPESSTSVYQILPASPKTAWEQFTPHSQTTSPIPEISQPFSRPLPSSHKPIPSPPIASPSFPWTSLFFLTWFTGSLFLALWFLFRQITFHRHSLRIRQTPSSSLQIALNRATQECGVKRIPKLWVLEGIPSPALSGFFSTAILVPSSLETDLSPAQIRMVFLHEIMHWKRRDPWTHLLALSAACIHWCNPLAWWLLAKLRAERELATDAAVLSRLTPNEQQNYGETLLHLAFPPQKNNLPLPSIGIFEKHADLKSRLRQIAHFSRAKWGWSLLAFLCFLAMLPFFFAKKADALKEENPRPPADSFFSSVTAKWNKNLDYLFTEPSRRTPRSFFNEVRIEPMEIKLFGWTIFEIKGSGIMIHQSVNGDLTTDTSSVLDPSPEAKANTLLAQGIRLLSTNRQDKTLATYRQAEECFTEAIEANPKNAEAWSRRCEARVGLHDYEGAVADADEALQRSPNYWHSLMYRGQAYHGLGRYYDAINDYDAILAKEPDFFWPPELKAYALLALDQPAAAYQSFFESWKRSKRLHVKHRMGLTALFEGNPSLAIENFGELQGLWGRHGECIASYLAGNTTKAEGDLSELCKMVSDWMDGAIHLYGIRVSSGKTSATFSPPKTVRASWQNTLVELGTRSISLENALEAVRDPENPYTTQTRQADCYLLAGYQALADRDTEKALSLFVRSAQNSVMLSHTYLLASHEAQKIAPSTPLPTPPASVFPY